ncbi:Hypothetical protein CAP_1451 [Chondromyces apiculatus DSM 436]|uniref:Uncharacterized protein n=1 Tax=Chondromyces apiculatus DSM 436 TaxID=1192034 RepID=A0A017TBY0_9BACT|nr:Hypothetical protein CAP_1451 [Chondromyces apiculatus DSM 436]
MPAIFDAIITRDIQAILELNTEVSRLFPDVKSIRLTHPSPATKALGVKLNNGAFIPADLMSEGLLQTSCGEAHRAQGGVEGWQGDGERRRGRGPGRHPRGRGVADALG